MDRKESKATESWVYKRWCQLSSYVNDSYVHLIEKSRNSPFMVAILCTKITHSNHQEIQGNEQKSVFVKDPGQSKERELTDSRRKEH